MLQNAFSDQKRDLDQMCCCPLVEKVFRLTQPRVLKSRSYGQLLASGCAKLWDGAYWNCLEVNFISSALDKSNEHSSVCIPLPYAFATPSRQVPSRLLRCCLFSWPGDCGLQSRDPV